MEKSSVVGHRRGQGLVKIQVCLCESIGGWCAVCSVSVCAGVVLCGWCLDLEAICDLGL